MRGPRRAARFYVAYRHGRGPWHRVHKKMMTCKQARHHMVRLEYLGVKAAVFESGLGRPFPVSKCPRRA